MNNHRRRNYRSRPQKNNFKRRNGSSSSNSSNIYNSGNRGFIRNSSLNNAHSVEKAISKFQQLAKDAQSSGDPVLAENYFQHADHYLRRLNELSEKNNVSPIKKTENSENLEQEENRVKEVNQNTN